MRCLSLIMSLLLVLQPFESLILQSDQMKVPFGSASISARSVALSSDSGAEVRVLSDDSSLTVHVASPTRLTLSAEGSMSEAAAPAKFVASMSFGADVIIQKRCQSSSAKCQPPHYDVATCNATMLLDVSVAGMNLLSNFEQDLCPQIREAVGEWHLPKPAEADTIKARTPKPEQLSATQTTEILSAIFLPARVATSGVHTEGRRDASGDTDLVISAEDDCAELRLSFPPSHSTPSSELESLYLKSVDLNFTLPKDATLTVDVAKDNFVSHISQHGLGFEMDTIASAVEPYLNVAFTLLRAGRTEGMSLMKLREMLVQSLGLGQDAAAEGARDEDDL